MTWEDELDEIRRRAELAKQMGGPENIKRQHDGGKLTVRERVDRLLDPGSWQGVEKRRGIPKWLLAGFQHPA